MGNGVQGVWVPWTMGHMGNGVQGHGSHGQWGYMGMGHSGQLGTRTWGTWAMGYRPSNVSECKKDVKCQKNQTLRLWRRFTKKEIDTMTFTHIDVNFDITYGGH